MSRVLTCPEGHSWSVPADGAWTNEPLCCPVCGRVAVASGGVGSAATSPVPDATLPPPPSPLPDRAADIAAEFRSPRVEPAAPTDIPGYQILAQLGRGGMGIVYKARHLSLDRLVALKVISSERLPDPEEVQRFRREARATARLSHPHIVTVYDAGDVGGTHFLVMEYVEGTDLARLLARRGAIPPPEACDYVRQAALGLEHAHQRGLVHRDVKPSNLLVTPQGLVKLLDLGLAGMIASTETLDSCGSLTRQGVLIGTPDYLAPEQAIDPHSADARADIYALGCTLYHLLTGRPPFLDSTLAKKLLRHQQEEPTPVEELCPDLPTGLGAVVRKAMAKRPGDRYQTAAALVDTLAPFCPPTEVTATRAGERPTVRTTRAAAAVPARPVRRRWPLVTAGAGGALLLALAIYWLPHHLPSQLSTAPERPAGTESVAGEVDNSIGMRLVPIPPGTFWMGASDQDSNDYGIDNERPRHTVQITKGFYLGAHEVTQGQYEAVMGQNPACFNNATGGTPNHPVESVSWDDAVAFCERLSGLPAERKAGRSYRLPTEAEWEYACRAGTSTAYHFGPTLSPRDANFDSRKSPLPAMSGEEGLCPSRTVPVGQHPPNAFGLFDMHGNVAEWCADRFGSSYYRNSPKQDPPGPAKSEYRVARGGGWKSSDAECRAAARGCFSPTDRHPTLGFRVVCFVGSGG